MLVKQRQSQFGRPALLSDCLPPLPLPLSLLLLRSALDSHFRSTRNQEKLVLDVLDWVATDADAALRVLSGCASWLIFEKLFLKVAASLKVLLQLIVRESGREGVREGEEDFPKCFSGFAWSIVALYAVCD